MGKETEARSLQDQTDPEDSRIPRRCWPHLGLTVGGEPSDSSQG